MLHRDPTNAAQHFAEPALQQIAEQQQKTVYNMIVRCIDNPQTRAVLTTALPAAEKTGFGAWRALRRHFIGDEAAYKRSLES